MENNEPAFGIVLYPNSPDQQSWPSLTKREYFAGLAMQGLLASYGNHDLSVAGDVAHDAVIFADALLSELSKPQP